jgi:hypothetical protein
MVESPPPSNPIPTLSGEIHRPGEPDLKALAEQINAEYDALKTALLSGAQRAIATGKLLLKAKALVRHGQWEEWVATNTNLSERAAQRCMSLASGEALLAAKAPNLADMTMTDAVKVLEELREPDAPRTRNTRQQRSGRGDAVTKAIKSGQALSILERAWAECTDQERAIFLKKNG